LKTIAQRNCCLLLLLLLFLLLHPLEFCPLRVLRLTNKAIRKTLNVNSLNNTISKYRNIWFNNIRRMDHSRFPRYMLSYKPIGKRCLGCPRKELLPSQKSCMFHQHRRGT
jgi:hypothetical protein